MVEWNFYGPSMGVEDHIYDIYVEFEQVGIDGGEVLPRLFVAIFETLRWCINSVVAQDIWLSLFVLAHSVVAL